MRNSKRIKIVAGGTALLMGAGVAYAYWTTAGSGTGSAETGTAVPVTIQQSGEISGLVPGGQERNVNFTITNPATYNQYVTQVEVGIDRVDGGDEDGKPLCTAEDFTVVQPQAINSDLRPGAHTYGPSGATIALKNLATNQDNCKDATVHLTFTAR
jgi:hypothetical protein